MGVTGVVMAGVRAWLMHTCDRGMDAAGQGTIRHGYGMGIQCAWRRNRHGIGKGTCMAGMGYCKGANTAGVQVQQGWG